MERADVVIVGAGLIGSAIAWRIAQAGRKVVLLDRSEPGTEASWAGAGLLQPEAGREANQETLGLWLESLAMYGSFVQEVREVTGAAFEYRVCGRLVAAFDGEQEERLRQRARAQADAGISYEWLTGDAVRHMEPAINPEVRAAIFYAQHALVDNRRLSVALAHAAAISGAQVRSYQPALSIASHGGKVEGVETPNGRIAADAVVNAAGSWSGLLVPTPKRFVGPAKGEIIALEARPRPFERVITLPGGSVSARADGRIVVGATIIDGSFSREISANGVARMLAAATSAIPALRDARFVEAWTGLRPHSLDDQPVIGQDSISGLYWATGHFTMGILSTPATADVVASLIEGRTPRVSISSMSPRRFAQ